MPTFSAIISARTLSTRVPRKLLRNFAGTTLVDIALEKLNMMDFVDARYLAIAEDELAEKCKKFPNIELMWRDPRSIAKGDVPFEIRTKHYAEVKTEYILIINPCHLFLTVETLKRAVKFAKETNFNSYTSVIPSVDWVFDQEGNPITNRDPNIVSTTETKKYYKVAHAFHIIKPSFLRQKGLLWTFTQNDPALILISEEEAFDIDTELEFTLAELLYLHRQKK